MGSEDDGFVELTTCSTSFLVPGPQTAFVCVFTRVPEACCK